MQESMIFYNSFYQAIKVLDLPTQAELYNAIFAYALEEKEPENLSTMANVVFTLIKPQIDANNIRRENGKKGASHGKKGGRPKKEKPNGDNEENLIGDKNKNPIGVIESEEEKTPLELPPKTPNVNVNDNVNVNLNENVNENENLNEKKETQKEKNAKLKFANAKRIIEMYNLQCPSLPKAEKVTSERIRAVNNVLKEYTDDEIETLFVKAENSAFLRGEKGDWKANFDWLMNKKNIVKVLEGCYDRENRLAKVDNW